MPRTKRTQSRTAKTEEPARETATSAPRESATRSRTSTPESRAPAEQALELLTRFSRETGETVTEFLRRFGEEQQKNYEAWVASFSDATRPTARDQQVSEVQNRVEEWNRRAEEIGNRVREAFQTALLPQRDLFETWARPFLPKDATTEDRSREATELVQKLWGGLSTNLSRRIFESLQPGKGVEDLVRAQEESLKEFTESFQKLSQLYFTSPSFVTLFGKTLDASLDLQKSLQVPDEAFSRLTGMPSRKEISELNQAVRDLSEKVARLNSGRA